MKKIFFSGVSSILALIGLSGFKSGGSNLTTYYWFAVYFDNITVGVKPSLVNLTSTFAGVVASTVSPLNATCSQDDMHQCLVGFTENQIFISEAGAKLLKTSGVVPGAPVSQPATTAPSEFQYTKE